MTGGTGGEDRRKHKRAVDVFIVTYRLRSPFDVDLKVGAQEYAAVAMDISEGGLGVDTGQPIGVGAGVRLRFKMVNEVSSSERNKERDFDLEGEARYCRVIKEKSHRVGIVFKSISAEEKAFIATYVKDQALRKYV